MTDADRAGDRFGMLDHVAFHERRRALCLKAEQPRLGADLAEPAPVGGDVAGVADRDAECFQSTF